MSTDRRLRVATHPMVDRASSAIVLPCAAPLRLESYQSQKPFGLRSRR